ncbi:coilin-like [Mizuhopecten yessoensis]|uniref:coilin-like n=1 Tax=Mizuhopecten yessoensis TaxID=6573 RepID=UPI000B45E295|nr:coilin-like [Mizuhopecten yessoensis]
MSATMEKHVRIRVFFENAHKDPTWLLVNNESMYTIKDLENEIRQRYFGNTTPLVMSLDGCVLPKSERTVILRDNDRVVVSESSHKESPSCLSLTTQRKRTVSADLDNYHETEENKLTPSTQDKSKKISKKESLPGTVRKEKKRAESADLYSKDEMEEIELTASTQDKIKNRKKKRKFDKCEKTAYKCKLKKTLRKQKKKNIQIDETQGSQLSVNTLFSKKNKKNPKKKKRKTESPVWNFNKKSEIESLTPLQQQKPSISTVITNTVPLNYSVETEVGVTKSVPSANKNRHESLGKGMEKDGVWKDEKMQEGDEEEKGVKKRRRRRKRQHKINMEVEAGEPNNKKKKYSDNKIQKPFHAKPFKTSIDIYGRKNNHKVFDESEPEEDTLPAQESWTVKEGTKTDGGEQMKSLQEAKQKLLEKVEREYKSVTDNSDILDRHLPTTQPLNETVQELATNKAPYQNVQEPSTKRPPHKIVKLQQPLIGEEQDDTGMSSVQLKLSALANGVPVYTRQRQKRYFNASQGKELSKELQLNTSLTNKSIIITNDQPTAVQKPVQESVCLDEPRPAFSKPVIPSPAQDYTKFPPLQGTPRQGDKIAYKVLELSDSYTPEVSNYKEGVVLNFYHDAQLVEIDTKQGGSDSRPQGKFHLDYNDEDNHHIEPKQSLPWGSLLETRLLDIV